MTSSVLLDTSVVIDLERLDLGEFADRRPAVSAVTVAELASGLDVDDLRVRQVRTDRFYAMLRIMAVVDFDLDAARLYGTMAATVRRAGRNPRPRRMDLQIAATAGRHGIPILTRNPVDLAGLDDLVDVRGL